MEKIDYLNLKTLADVKSHRARVDDELDRVKSRLKQDYGEVSRMFDFSYIAQAVAQRIARIYGIVETVLSGYDMVRGFIERFRSHPHRRQNCCPDD